MKYILAFFIVISVSACASSRQETTEQPKDKETWWLSKPADGLAFLLTWYKFPLTLETVDFFARGPEFYVRLEWNIKDGKTIHSGNFRGEVIGYMGNEFVLTEGEIQVVTVSRDFVELKFDLVCTMKNGKGAPMEIKETKRFTLQQSAPTLNFESKNAQIETLPDSLRKLRANTFNWNDSFVDAGNQRVFDVVHEFDGPCTTKPCEYYIQNRMIADSIQHFMFLNPSVLLELGFHTDTRGSESFNQFHSEKWANETKEMLVRRGVSKERITAVGYGESQPLVSDTVINATKDKVYAEKLHALNRRFGHVKVLKK